MLDPQYVAGLFDADGCVGAYVRSEGTRPYVNCSVANNYLPVLEMLKETYGGSIERRVGRDCMVWRVVGTRAYAFLRSIEPFSIVKKDQVVTALEIDALPKFDRESRDTHFALADKLKAQKKVRFA